MVIATIATQPADSYNNRVDDGILRRTTTTEAINPELRSYPWIRTKSLCIIPSRNKYSKSRFPINNMFVAEGNYLAFFFDGTCNH